MLGGNYVNQFTIRAAYTVIPRSSGVERLTPISSRDLCEGLSRQVPISRTRFCVTDHNRTAIIEQISAVECGAGSP
jgi:hypothetical protein